MSFVQPTLSVIPDLNGANPHARNVDAINLIDQSPVRNPGTRTTGRPSPTGPFSMARALDLRVPRAVMTDKFSRAMVRAEVLKLGLIRGGIRIGSVSVCTLGGR